MTTAITDPRLAQADLLLLAAEALRLPHGVVDPPDEGTLTGLVEGAGLPRAQNRDWLEALDPEPGVLRREEHSRLFEGGAACPRNETIFIRRDKGALLADIAGFYRAFGMQAAATGEKADTAEAELEFTALLLAMWTEAEREDRDEDAAVAREALAAFVRDHLGEWLPAFCARLEETARHPAFRSLARALGALWSRILAMHGLPVSPSPGIQDPGFDPDEDVFTCGHTDGGCPVAVPGRPRTAFPEGPA